jgi:hypothetical protein
MTFAEIKEMQKQFAEMARGKKEMETKEKMNSFIFSETNAKGQILPKAKDKFIAFASKLNDQLAAEFFEIIKSDNFKSVEL